jgi:acyl-coenzyme A synthetase/AMP-(fatty) acid ligase
MQKYPLLTHAGRGDVVAWRHGRPVTVAAFLADVRRLARALPAGGHVFNACADRYRFTVALAAALVSGKASLLPPSHSAETVRQMKQFAPDVFCIVDKPSAIDLPIVMYEDEEQPPQPDAEDEAGEVPLVPADQILAYAFTSGSTGAPVAHRKTWGQMVLAVRAEAAVLALPRDAGPANFVASVPPQHMYGIESSVLLTLQSGAALSSAHPFYPADVCSALAEVPRPRVLVTTPVHLRTLLLAGIDMPDVDLVLSATAPLSPELAVAAEAAFGAPLQEIYGATETGQIASRRSTQTREWSLMPGIALSRRDERFFANGGHVDPDTPLADLLELLPGGRFLLLGRIGDLVNIAGKRNSLAYLNHQLLGIEGVVDGVFFMPAIEAPDAATRLCAFAVAPGMTAAAVKGALRERIDAVFMPRPLVLVPELPRDRNGKITRATLDALIDRHLHAGHAGEEAQHEA